VLKVPLKSQSFNQPTPRTQKIIIAVSGLFGRAIREFVEVVGLFAASKLPIPAIYSDNTAKLYYLFRISMKGTFFSKLVQSYIAVCPHSCGPERAVSCYTILKGSKQSRYSEEELNSRMCIAMNSNGTANFDPKPAVAKFLQKKDRRNKFPTELYKDRQFVKKFLSD